MVDILNPQLPSFSQAPAFTNLSPSIPKQKKQSLTDVAIAKAEAQIPTRSQKKDDPQQPKSQQQKPRSHYQAKLYSDENVTLNADEIILSPDNTKVLSTEEKTLQRKPELRPVAFSGQDVQEQNNQFPTINKRDLPIPPVYTQPHQATLSPQSQPLARGTQSIKNAERTIFDSLKQRQNERQTKIPSDILQERVQSPNPISTAKAHEQIDRENINAQQLGKKQNQLQEIKATVPKAGVDALDKITAQPPNIKASNNPQTLNEKTIPQSRKTKLITPNPEVPQGSKNQNTFENIPSSKKLYSAEIREKETTEAHELESASVKEKPKSDLTENDKAARESRQQGQEINTNQNIEDKTISISMEKNEISSIINQNKRTDNAQKQTYEVKSFADQSQVIKITDKKQIDNNKLDIKDEIKTTVNQLQYLDTSRAYHSEKLVSPTQQNKIADIQFAQTRGKSQNSNQVAQQRKAFLHDIEQDLNLIKKVSDTVSKNTDEIDASDQLVFNIKVEENQFSLPKVKENIKVNSGDYFEISHENKGLNQNSVQVVLPQSNNKVEKTTSTAGTTSTAKIDNVESANTEQTTIKKTNVSPTNLGDTKPRESLESLANIG